MNVLSLFDGMSCGQIALDRAGIPVDEYYASEIDKYAIHITQTNYPHTRQIGDVTEVDVSRLPQIDLLIGGSPCQGLSNAGKRLGFDDPRSKLFYEYVRILKDLRKRNPDVKFLLENVQMKKDDMDIITEALGVDPVCINSSLVSAQLRKRYYWTNWDFDQPADKGLKLQSVLEPGWYSDRGKSYCIDAHYYKGSNFNNYFNLGKRQIVFAKHVKYDRVSHNSNQLLKVEVGPHNSVSLEKVDAVNKKDWRILTPLECERLQTVPEGYTGGVSNTQRYKMLGNGWTVDVISHILQGLKTDG